MGNYSEPASSSDSTCAFFARLRARLQSVIRAASRASLMKPLIFEIKSDCAAFRFFPRADSRFFSAILRLWFVCCWATADSCGVSWGEIIGASSFSASFPVAAEGGVPPCGREGPVRTVIRRLGKGGNSSCSSGSGSSGTLLAAVCGCATGLTCTAVAQGMFGRLLILHPPDTVTAQQRRTMTERRRQRGKYIRDRTGFSVMFRPRMAVRFGTSCPGRPPK